MEKEFKVELQQSREASITCNNLVVDKGPGPSIISD
jgi:hypothetical protein